MIALAAAVAVAGPTDCKVRSPTGGFGGRTLIEYQLGHKAVEEEARHAAAEMREPRPMPANGFVTIRVERATIELANAANHLVVIESAGVEIVRVEPEPDVANLPTTGYLGGSYWWNLLVVPIPDGVAFPLTVHAADRVFAHRCTWTLTDWGGVTRVKKP